MMRFGGTLTLNGLVVYVASNFEKVLLGRFWGVDALGIYGRAYQLSNIPTDNLNSAAGEVAFSALSRLQGDPTRLRSYFLKGYSLVLAMTLPITIVCALFADDMIFVRLRPKVDGCRSHFSAVGSDDAGLCHRQSVDMARLFAGTGRTKLEDGSGHRADHDCELYHGVALRTAGCRLRLLRGDVAVGDSGDCMVCARHSGFPPGCLANCEPSSGFKHRGGCAALSGYDWLTVNLCLPCRGCC